ncbi:MMPL family transporter [Schlesneria paludicola]|uniref:MMPL family transporter n=1 Tax=Schlesneria paludicola TaxID=360056 RepID=UPI00029A77FB|nr:MMPL family transporter [Schlesneria paludicola]
MQATSVDSPQRSVLTQLLSKLTELCARNAWATIFLVVLSAAGCVFYTAQNLRFKTDRSDLIDPKSKFYQRWLRYTKTFGESDDIVIVVESKHPEIIKQALDEIGSRLNAYPTLFKSVLYKVEAGALREKGLQYLPPELLTHGLERLDEFRPILSGNWDLVTLNGVVTRLQSQIARLRRQPEAQTELLQHAQALTSSLLATLRNSDEFTNPWPEILQVPDEMEDQEKQTSYLLNDAGTMGFVMASAVQDKGSFEGPTAAIDMVRQQLDETRQNFPKANFLLTGISVLENDEMRRSMADSTTASIISFIGVAVLLFLGFRGFRHPMLGLIMLAVAMSWSFGYTTLVIGHLNILSVSFAAMLMGLGIDFAVHIISRYLELRHEGHDLIEALVATSDSVGVGIITGAVTTSLAFFCATLTDFLGVAELGIIAGGGIMLCSLSAFTILPALLAVADRRIELSELPRPIQARPLRRLTRNHPGFVLTASLLCIGAIGSQAIDWSGPVPQLKVVYDHNLLNLQAEGLESVKAQKQIFDSSQHSLLYALSIADSAEEARTLKQKFEQLDSVHQVQELATRLPKTPSSQTSLLVQGYHSQLSTLPAEPPEPRPVSPAGIGQLMERLYDVVKQQKDPVSQEISKTIDQFLDELEQKSAKDQVTFLTEFQYRMSYALLAQFQAIAAAANPEPVTADDLPSELRTRFVSAEGKWLLQIFPKDQIWDMEPLERFVNDVRTIDPEATGTPLQNYEAARQIKQSYEICALYALGVILLTLLVDFARKTKLLGIFVPAVAVTLFVGFMMQTKQMELSLGMLLLTLTGLAMLAALILDRRAVGDSILALFPPMIGMGLTYGLLVMFEIPLNPANLIILPLILGIGVDNGVHILHDFHAKPNEVYSTSPSTINAIILTSTTTMVGFGSMMVSAHRGLYSLGLVLTIGVGACMCVSLVMLPAVLTLMSRHRTTAATDFAPLEYPDLLPVPMIDEREAVVIQREPFVIHEPIQIA